MLSSLSLLRVWFFVLLDEAEVDEVKNGTGSFTRQLDG
uniref:Uncharacterized protein n=1 Tax=Arundo donax TaxID=35708 RepID=A0A0A9G7N3_ARUDO